MGYLLPMTLWNGITPAKVNASCRNPSHADRPVLDLPAPEGWKAELTITFREPVNINTLPGGPKKTVPQF